MGVAFAPDATHDRPETDELPEVLSDSEDPVLHAPAIISPVSSAGPERREGSDTLACLA